MALFRRRAVKVRTDGNFSFEFPDHVIDLVVQLGDQLNQMLDDDSADLTRLFPTAYPDDPERDAGYQILARGELIDARRDSLDVVKETVRAVVLSEEQLSAWMRVVNDLRLVIGTKLDVSEDLEEVSPDDPRAELFAIYQVLGFMLSEIIDGLSDTVPDEGTEPNVAS